LGRSEEALPLAQGVAEAQEANPSLGPTHPETLWSRYWVAVILDRLGRSREALALAQAVAEAQEANPSLGSTHIDTLLGHGLVA
jgi:hypothetical protein